MNLLKNSIKKPAAFQRLFGVPLNKFKIVVEKIRPLWNKAEKQRKKRIDRKRDIGGGRGYKFKELEELVAIVLFYYRTYCTQEVIGIQIGLDQSNISRLHKKLLPLIEKAVDPELAVYLAKAKETLACMSTEDRQFAITRFFQQNPDLQEVYTDATEQSIYRATQYDKQKKHYSGKTKKHAIKTQITVAKSGRFLDVSQSYAGSVHDKTMMDQEKTIEKFPEETTHRLDSGYQGLVDECPDRHIILPYKKMKNRELTPLAKDLNRENSKRRVVVEHAICRVKKFKIVSQRYRGDIKDHNAIFRAAAAVENFKFASN